MTKILLEIEDEIWEKFKAITTRERTLNEIMTDLVKAEIEKNNKNRK